MKKIPDIAKTTYSGGLAGTSTWRDYASTEPLSAESVREAFNTIKESDEKRRQAEREHWNREDFTEAYTEISKAIVYYLDKYDLRSYYVLEICRMSMQYIGCLVSSTMAEEGRKLLDEYRSRMIINS